MHASTHTLSLSLSLSLSITSLTLQAYLDPVEGELVQKLSESTVGDKKVQCMYLQCLQQIEQHQVKLLVSVLHMLYQSTIDHI